MRSFFTDHAGRVVIAQPPNVPIIAWMVLSLAAFVVDAEPWRGLLSFFASAFLFAWAWMELAQGDSPFRRTLGAVVLAGIVLTRWLAAS